MEAYINSDNSEAFFTRVKLVSYNSLHSTTKLTQCYQALGVIKYFEVPQVNTALSQILQLIRWNLGIQQHMHWLSTGADVLAVARFDEYFLAHLDTVETVVREWAEEVLVLARKAWGPRIDLFPDVVSLLNTAASLRILRANFPLNGIPTNTLPARP